MTRRVVHVSSVHRAEDNRIHYKECASLASAGWEVSLVMPGTSRPPAAPGVDLHLVTPPRSRVERAVRTAREVFRVARSLRPDIVHFHDPELLPFAVPLARDGITTIYDVHEDVADTVAYKTYIPRALRPAVAAITRRVERWGVSRVSALVAATPAIAERVAVGGRPVVTVQNYPRLEELEAPDRSAAVPVGGPRLAYIGRISRARGAVTMLDLLTLLPSDVELDLAGETTPANLLDELKGHPAWARVRAPGFVDRPGVSRILAGASIGLILLAPERNYLDSYPTKMFEYMAAGIPVVASDFPLWRSVVERAECGLLVDPSSAGAAAEAVRWLLEHPHEARRMGTSGRRAVEAEFNWAHEARKLVALYDQLVPRA